MSDSFLRRHAAAVASLGVDERILLREERAYGLSRVEFRKDEQKGTLTLDGYASIVNHRYDVYGGPANGGWSEMVATGAFNKTLSESPDVVLLINHEGLPLARTKSGTLRLAHDQQGLRVDADLDPADPDVSRLQPKMARGDMDEMSFAFRVVRDVWRNVDGVEVPYWDITGVYRDILEVNINRGDVSVVNYGANPATSAEIVARDLDRVLAEARSGRLSPTSEAALRRLVAPEAAPDPDEPEVPMPEAAVRAITASQWRAKYAR